MQTLLFTGVMGLVMSNYFNVHQVLIMQGVLLPVNAIDNVLVKKYILGDTTKIHNELTEEPTDKPSEIKEKVSDDAPKVEILSETPAATTTNTVKKRSAAVAKGKSADISSIDE